MAKDLNKCAFIGRIGKEIDLKYTTSGSAVANFSLACSDDYKDKQGKKVEQTNWISIVTFGKLAEILSEYCGKGSKIYIEGKYTIRKWQDSQGQDRYTTEIIGHDMQMLDSKSENAAPSLTPKTQKQHTAPPPIDEFDDDIPF